MTTWGFQGPHNSKKHPNQPHYYSTKDLASCVVLLLLIDWLLLGFLKILFVCVCECRSMGGGAFHMCVQKPEDIRSPGAWVTGSCELPHVGVGNSTQVFLITESSLHVWLFGFL